MNDLPHIPKAAALSQTAGVAEGWKLVPVEPTGAMMEAAMKREDDEPLSSWGKIVPAPHDAIYRAMLAAAPAASGGEVKPEPSPQQCRERLMREGKPYPKSGCAVCKTGGMTGCPYEKAVHAPQPTAAAAVSERARELLAAECSDGHIGMDFVRSEDALRAIESALARAVPDALRYDYLRRHRHVLLVTGFFGNCCVNKEMADVDAKIDEAIASTATHAASRPADGDWVMVPREPTEAMLAVADEDNGAKITDGRSYAAELWSAMLASAPTSAQAGGGWFADALASVGDVTPLVTRPAAPHAANNAMSPTVRMNVEPTPDAAARASDDWMVVEAWCHGGTYAELKLERGCRPDEENAILALSGKRLPASLTTPSDAGGDDGWVENFSYLLGRCKHTIRSREGGGAEDLMQSAIITFTKMERLLEEQREPTPPNPGDARLRELAATWLKRAERKRIMGLTNEALLDEAHSAELLSLLDGKGVGGG